MFFAEKYNVLKKFTKHMEYKYLIAYSLTKISYEFDSSFITHKL